MDSAFVLFGIAALAIGILAALVGVGLFRQGRRVGKLMSGQALIAHWTYASETHPKGFVFIGEHGIYHNAQYTEWSRQCVLEGVDWVEGHPPMLHFRIMYVRRNSNIASTQASTKTLRVPIPAGHEADAREVLAHFLGN